MISYNAYGLSQPKFVFRRITVRKVGTNQYTAGGVPEHEALQIIRDMWAAGCTTLQIRERLDWGGSRLDRVMRGMDGLEKRSRGRKRAA